MKEQSTGIHEAMGVFDDLDAMQEATLKLDRKSSPSLKYRAELEALGFGVATTSACSPSSWAIDVRNFLSTAD